MSGEVQKWAWDIPLKSRDDKLVLIALAWHANDDGNVWASQAKMRREIGISRSGLKMKLNQFVEDGLITCETRFGTNGRQLANNYALNIGGYSISEPHPVQSELDPLGTVQTEPHEIQIDIQERNTSCGKPQTEDDLSTVKDVMEEFKNPKKEEVIAKAKLDDKGNLKPSSCGYLWRRFRQISVTTGYQPEILAGELKMLAGVRKRIDNDPVFIEAMWAAVSNWIAFTKFAQDKGGAFQMPKDPKIGFFVKYCAEAVAFSKSGGGVVADDFVHVEIKSKTKPLTNEPEVEENAGKMTHEQILAINAEFEE